MPLIDGRVYGVEPKSDDAQDAGQTDAPWEGRNSQSMEFWQIDPVPGAETENDDELSLDSAEFEAMYMPKISGGAQEQSKLTTVVLISGLSVALAVVVLVIAAVMGEVAHNAPLRIDDSRMPLAASSTEKSKAAAYVENIATTSDQVTTCSLVLYNPEGSVHWLVFELLLSDSGEMLYESEPTAPGVRLTDIALNRVLPTGEYNATLRIRSFAPELGDYAPSGYAPSDYAPSAEVTFQLKVV